MSHIIDQNDLSHIKRLGYNPKGFVPCPKSDDGHINPQLTKFALGDNRYVSVFHVKPVYYETTEGYWRPMTEITYHHGEKNIILKPNALSKMSPQFFRWLTTRQQLRGSELLIASVGVQPRHMVFATTLTAYPDPNTETTTYDGGTNNLYDLSTYSISDVHAVTSTTSNNDSAVNLQDNSVGVSVAYQKDANTTHHCMRSATLFDTSSISTDTIDSGVVSIRGTTRVNFMSDAYSYVAPVSLSTSSNTGWTTTDYNFSNWGTTVWATGINIGSFNTSGYNDFTLNATGEAGINKSGVTKIGFMDGHDIETQNWTGANGIGYVIARSADYTGTTSDPKLVIEHTASASTAPSPSRHIWW